jgi:DNA-binding GntR family transcriptional regulator
MGAIGLAVMIEELNYFRGRRQWPADSHPLLQASASEMAYDLLQRAIFHRRLKPDTIYNLSTIAQELGLSTTPVRDAINRLTGRGFIRVLPRRGIVLTALGREPFQGLFELWRSLEHAVVQRVVPALQDDHVETLSFLLGDYMQEYDPDHCAEADNAIHENLAALSGNPYLVDSLDGIADQCGWIQKRILHAGACMDEWKEHHRILHQRMESRDAAGAWAAMQSHIDLMEERFSQCHRRHAPPIP